MTAYVLKTSKKNCGQQQQCSTFLFLEILTKKFVGERYITPHIRNNYPKNFNFLTILKNYFCPIYFFVSKFVETCTILLFSAIKIGHFPFSARLDTPIYTNTVVLFSSRSSRKMQSWYKWWLVCLYKQTQQVYDVSF